MKKMNVADLALFSGKPMFAEKIYVGRPNVINRGMFLGKMNDMLDRMWLTNNGPYVQELEQKIAGFTGADHCIAVCNGTLALLIAIKALGLEGEIIVPSLTFIATAHALHWQGIKPVFCDVDPQTLNLDPQQVEQRISSATKAILGVHVYGRPCNISALEAISSNHGVTLLFDAAHAFGCSHEGQMVGNFGRAEVFSFHATKFFHTFEGGAVVTNDAKLAGQMRLLRNFGFSGYDRVLGIGLNGKMSEAHAAMGLVQLAGLDDLLAVNRRNYHQYRSELKETSGVELLTFNEKEKCNYQYVVMKINQDQPGINRDQMVQILHAENILARRYFYPGCHLMEPYKTLMPESRQYLKETERITGQVVCLPTGTAVGIEEIGKICSLINYIVANGREIQRKIAGQ